MIDAELLVLYEDHMRRDAHVPGMDAQRLSDLTRYLDRGGREGEILWHRFGDDEAEGVVAREIAHFSATVRRLNWKVYAGDRPATLPALLERAGFRAPVEDQLMIAAAEELAGGGVAPDPRIEIRALTDPDHFADLIAVWESVWPGEGGWAPVMADGLRRTPGLLRVLVAYDAERPVASGYIILDPRKIFAYLGGGATVATHRGRGLYRTLLQERARIARSSGIRHLAVEASPASAPILSRLGFRTITGLRHYARTFAAAPIRHS